MGNTDHDGAAEGVNGNGETSPAHRRFNLGPWSFDTPLILAPMEDVTSPPFRGVCRRLGADLVYTEFVSAGMLLKGARESEEKLRLRHDEHPVGVQIFGEAPGPMAEAAARAEQAGADVIDVNIGCPVKRVVGKGAGAALLRDLFLTEQIVRAMRGATSRPLTAKARIGWDADSIVVEDLARMLEDLGVEMLSVHARTREQGYEGNADWSWIARTVAAVRIPVIGNGDVFSPRDAVRLLEETGCSGVMLGRGVIGNPWLFSEIRAAIDGDSPPPPPSLRDRIAVVREHLRANVGDRGEERGVRELRKMYSTYLEGAPDLAGVRAELMRCSREHEVLAVLARLESGRT